MHVGSGYLSQKSQHFHRETFSKDKASEASGVLRVVEIVSGGRHEVPSMTAGTS